jgi:hypothetical protein
MKKWDQSDASTGPESPWRCLIGTFVKDKYFAHSAVRYIHSQLIIRKELTERRMKFEFRTTGDACGEPKILVCDRLIFPQRNQA